jgi:hypothetical protein
LRNFVRTIRRAAAQSVLFALLVGPGLVLPDLMIDMEGGEALWRVSISA